MKAVPGVTVEFRLLGHVEALLDGRRLDIGHARQRCVLVALLVDVNHPVPADQLIDRVWADDFLTGPAMPSPLTSRGCVRYSTELMCRSSASAVVLLNTDALSVDIHRFRHIDPQARATADPADAADLFDRALELWRGEPFASLDTPWINDVRNALDAERLSVALDRNDTALRAGRHTDLLGELVTAAQAHPLDERLAGQLMLAQYRSGRQAEALETYRQMRERLVEELGVDPSPPCATSTSRSSRATAPATVATRADANVQRGRTPLPRRATSFVGREQGCRAVADALHKGPLVTLTGVGGVGKTRLALEVAGREKERFRDGVWLCELAPLDDGRRWAMHCGGIAVTTTAGLGIEPTVIEYLRTRELLLVVDNCEHVLGRRRAARRPDRRHVPGNRAGHQPRSARRRRRADSAVPRWRSRTPPNCSPTAPGPAGRTSTSKTSLSARWPKSADGSTGCRWRSNWRRPECG